MKKVIIIIALMAFATSGFSQVKPSGSSSLGVKGNPEINTTFAQVKKDTAKPQYDYFVKVPASIFYGLLTTAHSYRDVLIYTPLMEPVEKLNSQASLDKALFEIGKLKADSTRVNIPIKK